MFGCFNQEIECCSIGCQYVSNRSSHYNSTPPYETLVNNRHCMMRIPRLGDRVWLCVYHCSLFSRMNKKSSKHYEGLKKIQVNRIFCIIISNMLGGKVRNW